VDGECAACKADSAAAAAESSLEMKAAWFG